MPEIRPSFAAALAVIVATAAILSWRRPLASLRFALSPQLVIFTIGAALLTGRLAETQPPPLVLLCGVLLAGIVSVMSRASEVARVRRMIAALADPARRERAAKFLVAWARAARPSAGNPAMMRWYLPLVCGAAGALLALDLADEACAMLTRVPAAPDDSRLAATRATLLAMGHLHRGRHDQAEEALAAAPAAIDHAPSQQLLDAARALLYAVQGRADDALAATAALAAGAQLSGLVLAVEAHARAQRGERELAKAALGQLREVGGAQALERIRAHAGPASELAAELE